MSDMKTIGLYGLGFVALIGVGVATDLFGIFYQKETAGIRGQSEAERLIESGSSRIQRYEEFFGICSAVQAKESAIDALRRNDSMDESRRDTAITSNEIARDRLIAEYNAKAGMAYTAARFLASNLPATLSIEAYDGTRTLCAVQ